MSLDQLYDNNFDYASWFQFNDSNTFNDSNQQSRDLQHYDLGLQTDHYTPDTYYCNQCLDVSGNNEPDWYVYSNRCNGCSGGFAASADATQRRIQNTVRVSQSEYLENLAGLNVFTPAIAKYGYVNWNQGSDRAEPGQVHRNVPSYGASSTKTSITRLRPGSCSAAGQGVDIKHGSYARYLARLKGRGPYRTETVAAAVPVEGNKTKKYGIAFSHRDDRCMCPL
jgi:hypothetical protein